MPISRDAFARKMTKALRRAGFDGAVQYDAERFALIAAEKGQIFLGSVYQLYTEASFWRRGKVLEHFARTMFETRDELPKSYDEARGNLVPVIRTLAYLDMAELLAKTSPAGQGEREGEGLRPQFAPIAGTLCCGLAYDSPNALVMFGPKQLEEWGVTFDDAMKSARYNLSIRSRDPFVQPMPGLFMAPWQDSNAAGRLMLTELLTRLPVKGEVIAMAPGRDYLFVTGSEDVDGLAAMVLACEKALAAPKANTPEMLRLQGTQWLPFEMPKDHPLAAKHQEMVKGFMASDYAEQKGLIEQINARTGADVFVANYSAVRRKDGEVYSYCTWAPCRSLLPRTDAIAIFDGDPEKLEGRESEPVFVRWDDVVAVVGHHLRRDEQYRLERYLVEASPTEAEMAELRKRALPA